MADDRYRGFERDRYDPRNSQYDRFDRDYGRDRDARGEDRGFFERAGDEVRSWFGDDEAERRRRMDECYDERYDRGQGRSDDRYRPSFGERSFSAERGQPRSEPGGYRSYQRSNRDEGGRGEYAGSRPYAESYYQPEEGRQFDDGPSYGGGGMDRGREAAYRAAYAQRDRQQGLHDDGHHDYRSWRDRQVQSFDRDYDEYRRENRTRFESEFASWRQNRQTQRDSLTTVKEHQEVVGSDGSHVGVVDHVRGDHILLTKNDRDAGGHHHSIPSSWIQAVGEKVTLSKTAEEAKRLWRDAEDRGGLFGQQGQDHDDDRASGLNRSFRGTY
jgi:hypothetical protein